eukprot:TRINITY_DN4514_c0_g1_i1.p1 TRINITY_DN4514_c0_g1~~TRINITY_DN4514_c0_g1_i1.p1  ORF type:complete len:353 (+),score=100.89 TRINITY_DN4514_c0_g1_i1:37-1095(+)
MISEELIPKDMNAIPFTQKNGKLKIQKVSTPKEGPDEVLIKVHAFGLNFADTIASKGEYPDAPPFPFIAGYEVSGTIVSVGSQVKKVKPGMRVAALTSFGGYAEYAVAKEIGLFELPEEMSFEEGASIPVVFVTAYYAIFMTGPVRDGDNILIHAAAGGVGIAAVQLAKLRNLRIFGTASTHKLDVLKNEWGVDHPIDYRNKDFAEEIFQITGKKKCLDIIIDSLGGSQLKKDQTILRSGGRIIGIGASALNDRSWSNSLNLVGNALSMMTISSIDMLMSCTSLCGVNLKKLADDRPEIIAECLEQVKVLFQEGKLRTYISKVYDWQDIAQAHADIQSRGTIGKMVLLVKNN